MNATGSGSELSVQQSDALWDAVAIPGPEQPSFPEQHKRVTRVVAELIWEARQTERRHTLLEAASSAQKAVSLYENSDEAAAAAGAMEGIAARFRLLAEEPGTSTCSCTSGSPAMYEGPARDCPLHGDQTTVVAYRAPGLDVVYCVQCHPEDGRFIGVDSDELPESGICANCDTDVLIRATSSPCPRCSKDVSRYAPDDLVYRSGNKRPYCSGECAMATYPTDDSATKTDAEIIEMGRQVGLVEPEKAPRIIDAARELFATSGIDTPGCDCAHEGMGAVRHLKSCSWLKTLNVPHPDQANGGSR